MIKFDSDSIYQRALQKLQQDPNWKVISNNSVVSALLRSNAEVMAETARYAEYLFKESRWDAAQNRSSILSMSNLLGYQPKRKISARGSIWISADARTHQVGKSVSSYTFSNLNNSNTVWQTLSNPYAITSDVTITDSAGNSYIAIPRNFPANTKTMELNVIQGKKKSAYVSLSTIQNTATQSKFDPYLYIPITIHDCEDASNSTSKAFFRVYIEYKTGTTEEYRVVDTLLTSNATDKDVEVYNDLYSQELFYLKFNNDPNRGATLDISKNSSLKNIRVDYIESSGEDGNVLELFRTFTISGIKSGGGNSGIKLYGVNLNPISGGQDEETVADVKVNAPLNYINFYTAGTKEAYETAIENMDLVINGTTVQPRKVQVYGSTEEDSYGNLLPITCISFIADGLEDLVSGSTIAEDTDDDGIVDPYDKIEESLNYYLYRLKSPQDTLRFVAPNYVAFAVGLKCLVNNDDTDDITQLQEDIRDFIDTNWGSNSDVIDFERNFYPSALTTDVMNNFPEVVSITTEVEAIKKLNVLEATRILPKENPDDVTNVEHTFRIPFNFDKSFIGNLATKGFKDYRVGADYVMRVDIMYKKPKGLTSSSSYHVSIFVSDGRTQRDLRNSVDADGNYTDPTHLDEITDAFYYKRDTADSGIWDSNFATSSSDYSYLADICNLTTSYQVYYRPEVYSDNDYRSLIENTKSGNPPTLSSYQESPGAVDNMLFYFSADYDDADETIGDGWVEFTFDPFMIMLKMFAKYDTVLNQELAGFNWNSLKCSNDDTTDTFQTFINILNRYVDFYVSFRPIDPDIQIDLSGAQSGSTVLYIDSYDGTSINNTMNLTTDKRNRMIYVNCEYEEY